MTDTTDLYHALVQSAATMVNLSFDAAEKILEQMREAVNGDWSAYLLESPTKLTPRQQLFVAVYSLKELESNSSPRGKFSSQAGRLLQVAESTRRSLRFSPKALLAFLAGVQEKFNIEATPTGSHPSISSARCSPIAPVYG